MAFAPVVPTCKTLMEPLFADSTHSGKRVRDYTNKKLSQLLGQMTGPLVQLAMFHSLGNAWSSGVLVVRHTPQLWPGIMVRLVLRGAHA